MTLCPWMSWGGNGCKEKINVPPFPLLHSNNVIEFWILISAYSWLPICISRLYLSSEVQTYTFFHLLKCFCRIPSHLILTKCILSLHLCKPGPSSVVSYTHGILVRQITPPTSFSFQCILSHSTVLSLIWG
jgi:hypothetical protein